MIEVLTGASQQLRHATWACHQNLERRVDVKARFADSAAYRAHLQRLWGFYAAVEATLDPELLATALPDYPTRRKAPLLERDLHALDTHDPAIGGLPLCSSTPRCSDTTDAFGCLYVLEGATLGGQALLGVAARTLGVTPAHGAAFLASYGARTADMWIHFKAACDLWCRTPARVARAAAIATLTFDCIADWLCPEDPSA